MVIGEAVAGNRVAYNSQGTTLLGYITGVSGPNVQVLFDRDISINQISEVPPNTLTVSTDGGYLGDSQGPVTTS